MAMPFLAALRRAWAVRRTDEPRQPDQPRVPFTSRTLSSVVVTPDTAVYVSAVWACLRYLSQSVAVLPWHVYRQGEKGGELATSHPVDWLIYKRPNPEWTSFQLRETLTHWALRWGNAICEIERDQIGRPAAVWPIHPERVSLWRDPASRKLFYRVDGGVAGRSVDLDPADVFHVRGFGEGPWGVNVMHYAAESIGWARAAQLFGASFFGNGATASGIVETKRPLKEAGLARLKAEFANLYKGVRRSNKVMVLDNEMTFKPVMIEPDKAQFIATNQHLVEEVARWFGVPPHKIMHLLRATFSNIDSQAVEVVVDSISPWVKRFEDEAELKLFGPENRQGFYTKMNMTALLRGDPKTRGEYYQLMRNMGVYCVDDILRLEDQDPIGLEAGGEKRIVQSQYTTLEKIGEEAAVATPPSTAEPSQPDPGIAASLGRIETVMGVQGKSAPDLVEQVLGD